MVGSEAADGRNRSEAANGAIWQVISDMLTTPRLQDSTNYQSSQEQCTCQPANETDQRLLIFSRPMYSWSPQTRQTATLSTESLGLPSPAGDAFDGCVMPNTARMTYNPWLMDSTLLPLEVPWDTPVWLHAARPTLHLQFTGNLICTCTAHGAPLNAHHISGV